LHHALTQAQMIQVAEQGLQQVAERRNQRDQDQPAAANPLFQVEQPLQRCPHVLETLHRGAGGSADLLHFRRQGGDFHAQLADGIIQRAHHREAGGDLLLGRDQAVDRAQQDGLLQAAAFGHAQVSGVCLQAWS
jgi:hypothetical protein